MSLTIEVEFLTGRYTAMYFNDRSRAEWPPHPARLFSAAVAAWADAEHADDSEREVLEWLEQQPAPLIACDLDDDVARRAVVTHYVPVNDAAGAIRTDHTYDQLRAARIDVETLRGQAKQAAPKVLERAAAQLDEAVARSIADSRKATERTLAAASIKLLPDERGKQPRTFPSVAPRNPEVAFSWPSVEPTVEQRAVLDALLARIGRLGHSSSFVSCRIVAGTPDPALLPDGDGDVVLRVLGRGQFQLLEEEFASHGGIAPRVLPALMQPYARAGVRGPDPSQTVFSRRWMVFVVDSDRLADDGESGDDEARSARVREDVAPLSIRASLPLARSFRVALIEHAGEVVPELLSGREKGTVGVELGAPSRRPHAAIVPLPFVGHRHADSLVRGVAIVLPNEVSEDEHAALMSAIQRWETEAHSRVLVGGRAVQLVGGGGAETLATLRPGTWCRKSACWATVTPLALDRFPGNLRARDPQQRDAADDVARHSIARACKNIGLPLPVEVIVRFDATVSAVPPVRVFPAFKTPNGGPRRTLVHAHLRFENPIAGPVLLGAGRFVGQGLCMPVQEPTPDA